MSILAKGRKTPETRLGRALRTVAKTLREEARIPEAHRAEQAAADLDKAALSLGARGERVKQLGAYYQALQVFKRVTGKDYEA